MMDVLPVPSSPMTKILKRYSVGTDVLLDYELQYEHEKEKYKFRKQNVCS